MSFDRTEGSRLPDLAAELVRLKVDLIVTWFTPAAEAAKQADVRDSDRHGTRG